MIFNPLFGRTFSAKVLLWVTVSVACFGGRAACAGYLANPDVPALIMAVKTSRQQCRIVSSVMDETGITAAGCVSIGLTRLGCGGPVLAT